jgi:hypothetical protein
MQARHWSNEISNIVNEMQSAPDGFYNSLDIPRTGKFYIYNSMVRADFDGSNKHDSFFLQKLDSATKEWKSIVVKEDGAAIIDTAPIIVENTKTKAINFYKKDGKIIITTTSR